MVRIQGMEIELEPTRKIKGPDYPPATSPIRVLGKARCLPVIRMAASGKSQLSLGDATPDRWGLLVLSLQQNEGRRK